MAARKWTDCNVFQPDPGQCTVWHFDLKGKRFVARGQQSFPADQPFPKGVVGGGWKSLIQPRLNVAWLPAASVFLRVVQLPQCVPAELTSMVELQLEKLSPLPITQIVWNAHSLGEGEEGMQTVLVVIAVLDEVEAFLGRLEAAGLYIDRLDVPAVDQLKTLKPDGDGAWILPDLTGVPGKALVAWWSGGILRSLGLVELPAEGEPGLALRDQLMQMAWAGEIEGWLAQAPRWHLIAGTETHKTWFAALQAGLEGNVDTGDPASTGDLALQCANRSAQAGVMLRGLLPAENAVRYRQQFNDRLWMRGLGAALVMYVVCVLVYFGAVAAERWRLTSVEKEVVELGPAYTNAMDLKATWDVLNDLHELKYAALDCWKLTAERLPAGVELDGMNFREGSELVLNGTAPEDADLELTTFWQEMRDITVDGKPMFRAEGGNELNYKVNPRAGKLNWNFSLVLKRSEVR